MNLVERWRKQQKNAPIRLLGVAARDLSSANQASLFSDEEAEQPAIDSAIDEIRAKFGDAVVGCARSVKPGGDG